MKIWFDKKNPAPKGYLWARDTKTAIKFIIDEEEYRKVTYQSLDDAVEAISIVQCDGFGTELIEWLKETGRNYTIVEHANESAVERYKKHKAKSDTSKSNLKEICRVEGDEWCLIIKK